MSSRQSPFGHPSFLGFEAIEQMLDRVSRTSGDGYPPFNVERVPACGQQPATLRIMIAVAGFRADQLDVSVEDSQLTVRGHQADDKDRVFLHRGIAARQFQRTFVLADGMDVVGADLVDGLLRIDLVRPEPVRTARRIDIVSRDRLSPAARKEGSS